MQVDSNNIEEECLAFHYLHYWRGGEVSLHRFPEFGDYRYVPTHPGKITTLWNIIFDDFLDSEALNEFLFLALGPQGHLVTSSLPQRIYQLHRNSGSHPSSVPHI